MLLIGGGVVNRPISEIKGVGAKRAEILNKMEIFTLEDILYYFPRTYEDRANEKKISDLEHGESAAFTGEICSKVTENFIRRNLKLYKVKIKDDTGILTGVWFNKPFLKNVLRLGDRYTFYGKITKSYGITQVSNPIYEKIGVDEAKHTGRIVPIYPSTAKLTSNIIRGLIFSAVESTKGKIPEYIPQHILDSYGLQDINTAIQNIHFPDSIEAFTNAKNRMVFDELFLMQLFLFRLKTQQQASEKGISFYKPCRADQLLERLDFDLTSAQQRVWEEIEGDMNSVKPMNRLVQGDVGSGKTIVAVLAILKAIDNGYQAAMMAPTEILANQHFKLLRHLLTPFDINVELLSGSCKQSQKRDITERLKNGSVDVVVGTHAIIQEGIEFDNLGLVITDEQHRFGVRQRSLLGKKGNNPDIIVMSATPIPRTLALILYGDLDISIIDEMPPGRIEIKTYVVDESMRQRIYNFIRKQVNEGRQVYIICSLVEDSTEISALSVLEHASELSEKLFPDLNVSFLHGKMKAEQKDEIMNKFAEGEISILVSTTVVEVGINVPNASVMVVENAERFGLSQLHQLRGRVGRGKYESFCILFNSSPAPLSVKRLGVLQKTNDGFKIAEKDLQLRGPGDFFGTRQHGLPDMKIANLYEDIDVLKQAQDAAKALIELDPTLSEEQNQLLRHRISGRFEERLDRTIIN